MSAEQLIALEASLADLSRLYPAARSFVSLQSEAESELLPFLTRLGAELRALRRKGLFDDAAALRAATAILAEADKWHRALETIRQSSTYQSALEAWAVDDQGSLNDLIPRIFSGHQSLPSPASLCFARTIVTHRRQPGSSPFPSVDACADLISRTTLEGISLPQLSGPWWESELQPIACAIDPLELDSTVILRKTQDLAKLSLFSTDLGLGVFTRRVAGPFSVLLTARPEDEWWEAYEENYDDFRRRLAGKLRNQGLDVELL